MSLEQILNSKPVTVTKKDYDSSLIAYNKMNELSKTK